MSRSWQTWLRRWFAPNRPARAGRRLALEALEDRLAPATFVVTTTGDASVKPTLVANPQNNPALLNLYNAPTLRGAMEMAETIDPSKTPVSFNGKVMTLPYNTILFRIANSEQKISVGSALPEIKTYSIVISGYPPRLANGLVDVNYANQVIVLDGSAAKAGSNGFVISAGKSQIKGLVIDGFKRDANQQPDMQGGNAIVLTGKGGNHIRGNLIGTDSSGMKTTDTKGNSTGNEGFGVFINGSPDNTVGGVADTTALSPRNILSGNRAGIEISGIAAKGNKVFGNYIGTDKAGTGELSNNDGIVIDNAPDNRIGGALDASKTIIDASRNLISGNRTDGIEITGADAKGNRIEGNRIGTKADGKAELPNRNGVAIREGAQRNTVGGTASGARNLISGNRNDGVLITGANTNFNYVQGNFLGTDVDGKGAVANRRGVDIRGGASFNQVGGAMAKKAGQLVPGSGAANVISGNTFVGVRISAGTGNGVQGNLIGLQVDGATKQANGEGVNLTSTVQTTVGGQSPEFRNTISGNAGTGLTISGTADAASTLNEVYGNYIGTDFSGTKAVANDLFGLSIEDSSVNKIGALDKAGNVVAGARNVISGNKASGVNITGAESILNVLAGDIIGRSQLDSKNNTVALGNTSTGIHIGLGAVRNTVVKSLVASNDLTGIWDENPSFSNTFSQNSITDNNGKGKDPKAPGGIDVDQLGLTIDPVPILKVSAIDRNSNITITGSLKGSAKNATVTIQFFVNTAKDTSGYGQGKVFVGDLTVQTDANGNTRQDFTKVISIKQKDLFGNAVTIATGNWITATATTPKPKDGSAYGTTEFSKAVDVPKQVGLLVPTTTTVVASMVNPTYGQTQTFTATVTDNVPGAGVPTGLVSFFDDGALLGAGTLDSTGVATLTATSNLMTAGTDTITAEYAGQGNFLASAGSTTEDVSPAALTITADNQSKVYGATLPTLTASYSGFVNGDTAANLTTLPTLTTTATAGSHVSGSPYSSTASGAVDPNYTINYVAGMLAVTPAVLTITANSQSKVYGAALPTLTASFSRFVNGDTAASLTTPPVLSTTATASSTVSGSPYSIAATGAADSDYAISFVPGSLTVNPAGTTTTLTANSSTSVFGEPINFTASVVAVAPGAGTPTGTVAFKRMFADGSVVTVGTGTLDPTGTAVFVMDHFVPATATMFAVYLGDGNFTTSTSPTLSHVINKAATTLTLSLVPPMSPGLTAASTVVPGGVTVTAGQPVNLVALLSVVPPGAFVVPATGTITFYDTFQGSTTPLSTVDLSGPPGTSPAFTAAGTHLVSAVYSGDSYFLGSSTMTPFVVTVTPAAATHLQLVPAQTTVLPGTPFAMTVTALDAYGNVATGYVGTLHFTSSDPQASVPGNVTFSPGNGGVMTVSGFALRSPADQTFTAADTVTPSITGTIFFHFVTG
jgi:hypothetical protein